MSDDFYLPVQSFYDAFIQREKDNFKFTPFSDFPKNCCQFSSLLLASFLDKNFDLEEIKIVEGVNLKDEYDRHQWLSLSGIYIDITIRQFGDALPPISISMESLVGWHDKYKIVSKKKFDPDFDKNFRWDIGKHLLEDYSYLEERALQILTNYQQSINDS